MRRPGHAAGSAGKGRGSRRPAEHKKRVGGSVVVPGFRSASARRRAVEPCGSESFSSRLYSSVESVGCGRVAEEPSAYDGDLSVRARALDRELKGLARDDALARLAFGRLASRFLQLRGAERLGFARLSDYSAERLGWSARQLEETARVADALAGLPGIETEFRRGMLGWSKLRVLVSVASPDDEARWLAVAASTSVRTLARVTANARAASREEHRLAEPVRCRPPDELTATSEVAVDSSGTARGDPRGAREPLTEDEEEERVLVRIECSRRARRLWNEARRLGSKLAGRRLSQSEIAEMVAAEASSCPRPFEEEWLQEPWRSLADTQISRAPAESDSSNDDDSLPSLLAAGMISEDGPLDVPFDGDAAGEASRRRRMEEPASSPGSAPPEVPDRASPFDQELERLDELDAFELDAAMRRVRTAMQCRQSRLGDALGRFVDLRLHETLGFASVAAYVREHLGLAERTARDLVRVSQSVRARSDELAHAYESGEISALRVAALLAVVRPWNARAWIARAREVTHRRLVDEVEWAAAQADLDPRDTAAMPPPSDHDLGCTASDRQMCADAAAGSEAQRLATSCSATSRGASDRQMCAATAAAEVPHPSREDLWGSIGRIRVTFLAPVSTSILFRTVMRGFAHPAEPRWLAFERMIDLVLSEWRRQPRHRDPVFARDGYRCTAPGCTSLRNLHDHHIVPRSAGGSNDLSNRTTLCAWHHLRAVHGGLARATGVAPAGIDWELGLASGRKPLMRTRGDRYASERD